MRSRLTKPGSALVAATLLAVLLAAAATALLSHVASTRATTAEAYAIAKARFAASSAIEATLVTLDRGGDGLTGGGAARTTVALASGARVRIQDASGLIDINVSSPSRLAALLRTVGLSSKRADTIADHIADWRDEDDARRPLGAEAEDYRANNLPPPANAPFETETQLRDVLGVSADLAACLAPNVTTLSASNIIDLGVATPAVKAAVAGESGAQFAIGGEVGAPIGHLLIITSDAALSPSASLRVVEWVRLTGDSRQPILVHRAWTDFASPDDASCARARAEEPAT